MIRPSVSAPPYVVYRSAVWVYRNAVWPALAVCAAISGSGGTTRAYANLVIHGTFDSSITSLPYAAAVESSINAAIGVLENDIASNVTFSIDFQNSYDGLGENSSNTYIETYYDYYNALKTIDTTPGASVAQQMAFASLGPAPANESSANPVNGTSHIVVTGPNGRVLGFNTNVPPGQFDTTVYLNTSLTSPPGSLANYYGLQSVVAHEIDEGLGIGGWGSFIDFFPNPGVLDLYRYSAPGVRSYTDSPSAIAYFSIDDGQTILSYFNQEGGGSDYGDWASDPIPAGFNPQVQDAFGEPGTDPALGVNELTALNVIGYQLVPVPEPMSLAIMLPGLLSMIGLRRRARRTVKNQR